MSVSVEAADTLYSSTNRDATVADTPGKAQSGTAPAAQSKWLSESAARARGSDADEVRSHYDISNEFFKLWQDPNQVYSCAYFECDDMSLEEAQMAKIDLALGKLDLRPGMTLLDIGCGWGAAMMRAIEKYDVNVVGLTLSENQKAHVERLFAQSDSPRGKRVLLQGWEQFNEPVDRIVSIGAFEHFGFDRYDDFFKMAHALLPDDGVMLLHTITALTLPQMADRKIPLTFEVARFVKFILTEIFPGGRLPSIEKVEEHSGKAGFTLTRRQSLQLSLIHI